MTRDEAIKIAVDVMLHRAPHTRHEIKEAEQTLEPPAQKPAAGRGSGGLGNLD